MEAQTPGPSVQAMSKNKLRREAGDLGKPRREGREARARSLRNTQETSMAFQFH